MWQPCRQKRLLQKQEATSLSRGETSFHLTPVKKNYFLKHLIVNLTFS